MKLKTDQIRFLTVCQKLYMLVDSFKCWWIVFRTEPLLKGSGTTKSATVHLACLLRSTFTSVIIIQRSVRDKIKTASDSATSSHFRCGWKEWIQAGVIQRFKFRDRVILTVQLANTMEYVKKLHSSWNLIAVKLEYQ